MTSKSKTAQLILKNTSKSFMEGSETVRRLKDCSKFLIFMITTWWDLLTCKRWNKPQNNLGRLWAMKIFYKWFITLTFWIRLSLTRGLVLSSCKSLVNISTYAVLIAAMRQHVLYMRGDFKIVWQRITFGTCSNEALCRTSLPTQAFLINAVSIGYTLPAVRIKTRVIRSTDVLFFLIQTCYLFRIGLVATTYEGLN